LPLFNCVLLIGNFNSNVGNENVILLVEIEYDGEGIMFTLCIKFVKLNVYNLTFIFQHQWTVDKRRLFSCNLPS